VDVPTGLLKQRDGGLLKAPFGYTQFQLIHGKILISEKKGGGLSHTRLFITAKRISRAIR
jgi:hypothetical protein